MAYVSDLREKPKKCRVYRLAAMNVPLSVYFNICSDGQRRRYLKLLVSRRERAGQSKTFFCPQMDANKTRMFLG